MYCEQMALGLNIKAMPKWSLLHILCNLMDKKWTFDKPNQANNSYRHSKSRIQH